MLLSSQASLLVTCCLLHKTQVSICLGLVAFIPACYSPACFSNRAQGSVFTNLSAVCSTCSGGSVFASGT